MIPAAGWRPGGGRCLAGTVVACLALLPVPAAGAQEPGWRLFGGGVAYRWRTTGGSHGHTRECDTGVCDQADWRRGNLDNAIGWRLGAEQAFGVGAKLSLVAGGELSVLASEYNLSQRDVTIVSLSALGGAELDLGALRIGVRGGAGGAVAEGRAGGMTWLAEGVLDVAVGGGVALRLAARRAELAGPKTEELSLLLVSDFRQGSGGVWEYGWAWGITAPGGLLGDDLELSSAPLWRLTASRRLSQGRQRIGLAFGATSHESRLTSDLGEVPGNQRGKWVLDLSVTWERLAGSFQGVRWRWGGGVRLAGFHDDVGTLLVDRHGRQVGGGLEAGLAAHVAVELAHWGQATLVSGVEHVYWPGIDLGELCLLAGIEVRP